MKPLSERDENTLLANKESENWDSSRNEATL